LLKRRFRFGLTHSAEIAIVNDSLRQASDLVAKLRDLAIPRPHIARSGDEIATEQLAVFGELLVALARYMDGAQRTITRLTWVLTVLTTVLVVLTAALVVDAAPHVRHAAVAALRWLMH
jgi:hypothetical protein